MSDGQRDREPESNSVPRKPKGRKNSISAFSQSSRRAANFKELQPVLRNVLPSILTPNADEEDSTADEHAPLVPISSKLNDASAERCRKLRKKREEYRAQVKDEDREPLLVETIQRGDGTEAEVIVGQSTLPQTVFNSSNVLIGIGMLSLPLGFRYTGWVIGLVLLIASAFATRYSAKLLAKCLDADTSLANFADIAYVAFGEKGRVTVSTIFTLELIAANVSLVVLFADSLDTLVPKVGILYWKIICGVILCPLNFIPMRFLGYTSFLGIFCMVTLVIITIADGCIKRDSPGSLRSPAHTYAFPQNWKELPLSFGLLMAVWGGHSVFPNIYRDMQHPWKYSRGLVYIFTLTTSMDTIMAVLGFLMFGVAVKDELSTNLLTTKEYPSWLGILVLIIVAVVPLTKFPLHCTPVVSTLEVVTRIDPRAALLEPNRINQSKTLTRLLKAVFRISVVVITTLIAVVVPSFELVSALMGALFCFLICIVIPCSFHLKMFGKRIPRSQRLLDWFLIVLCSILAVIGTVWEFLPRNLIDKA